jgi:RNA polymerase Rpb2, domain 6
MGLELLKRGLLPDWSAWFADMEDAMILNKSAVERGLARASVYKTTQVDLRTDKGKNLVRSFFMTLDPFSLLVHFSSDRHSARPFAFVSTHLS